MDHMGLGKNVTAPNKEGSEKSSVIRSATSAARP